MVLMNRMYHVLFTIATVLSVAFSIEIPEEFQKSNHSNNWAVLVDTSRFWFNYRHVANVLSIYRSVKRLGIPDSQIILMISDDMACNPRNPRPATIFNNAHEQINVYGDDVEVDYRGYEVRTKKPFYIYCILLAYNEIFFIIDTCQASSMYEKFYSPNILATASSLVGEDSLSHHVDSAIGVYIIDRYTYYVLQFLENVHPNSKRTMSEFLAVCPKSACLSTVGVRRDLFKRDPDKVPITDFFGSVRPVIITTDPIDILDTPKRKKSLSKLNKTKSPVKREYLPQFPMHLVPNTKTG
ncbi:hypothetical protein HW555_000114 [Spodoptera exigua]|uniref:GPI-anchor transamidase n=1 Tax=Spodoptera exigua TaxID=7107 RepID=A0A835GWN0_SPOEX|nr:hypothetical protein HW555_000114 [Spodoptera exigua]